MYRRFIVKNYFGGDRAAYKVFIVFAIIGATQVYGIDSTPALAWYEWAALALLIPFVAIPFISLTTNPPIWEEMDDYQKFQFGYAPNSNLTKEQEQEWLKLREKYYVHKK